MLLGRHGNSRCCNYLTREDSAAGPSSDSSLEPCLLRKNFLRFSSVFPFPCCCYPKQLLFSSWSLLGKTKINLNTMDEIKKAQCCAQKRTLEREVEGRSMCDQYVTYFFLAALEDQFCSGSLSGFLEITRYFPLVPWVELTNMISTWEREVLVGLFFNIITWNVFINFLISACA